jgi:thioesterase domain-containing protein
MKLNGLQEYLYENIPLSAAMGIIIKEANCDRVILQAPLLPNINHKKTAFGGSLHTLATLSCWSLVFINLKALGIAAEIVITSSTIQYLKPVQADFTAECLLEDKQAWDKFLIQLVKKGKSRLVLKAHMHQGETLAASYVGEFAALTNMTKNILKKHKTN